MNNTQDHIKFDEINVFENCFRSIRNIRFENVKHRKFFYWTNIMKKRIRLIWTLSKEIVVDRTCNALNNTFHAIFQKINFFNYSFQFNFSSFKKQFVTHDNYRDFFKNLYIINVDKNSARRDHQTHFVQSHAIRYQSFVKIVQIIAYSHDNKNAESLSMKFFFANREIFIWISNWYCLKLNRS